MRVQAWHLARPRPRSVAAVTIAVVAFVLVLARPAWAHTPSVSGTTSCPDENHLVSWTINNDPDPHFGAMTILSVKATVGAIDYGLDGYDHVVPPAGATHGTTTVPGDVTGTITLVLHVKWPDNFEGHTQGTVELQPPCHETSTTTASTTTTSTPPNSGTSPASSPPVSGGSTPTSAGGGAGGIEAGGSPTTAGGAVQAAEAGGTLPRTGAPSTNWALVGLASLAFGAALLLVSRKPARLRRP